MTPEELGKKVLRRLFLFMIAAARLYAQNTNTGVKGEKNIKKKTEHHTNGPSPALTQGLGIEPGVNALFKSIGF